MKYVLLLCGFFLATTSFAQQYGDSLFSPPAVHIIRMDFAQSNYWSLLTAGKAFDDANDSSTYIPATVSIDGTTLDSVGIQFKGNSSYYNYPGNKKPFTLSMDEYINGQKYNGLKSFNLNNGYQDPTMMREKLFLDFLNEEYLLAPRSNYAKLYINGNYWGLYLMVERVDKNFVKDRTGNKQGNLFKGDKGTSACATLQYHGVMSAYYNCYTLKTNNTANDWSDLVNLCYNIYAPDSTEFRDSLEAVFNTPSFIGSWAACNLFVNFDSYAFRYPHNYYIYHNTATDKFDWITWDVSTVFGVDIPATISQIENYSVLYTTTPSSNHPLVNRMITDSFYRKKYLETVCNYATYKFLPTILNRRIDSLQNLIQSAYFADTLKAYSNSDFSNNINVDVSIGGAAYPGLKSFIANRSTNVLSELNGLGLSCASQASQLNCDSICVTSISYDTANDYNLFVTIENNGSTYMSYPIVQLINTNGDTVANAQKTFEFYGQLPHSTQTYHIPTTLSSFTSNWTGQIRLEDGLNHSACIIDYPCTRNTTSIANVIPDISFSIYPNPSGGKFSILPSSKFKEPSEVHIYTPLGQTVYQTTAMSNSILVVDRNLEQGIYFIELVIGKSRMVKKLIIRD